MGQSNHDHGTSVGLEAPAGHCRIGEALVPGVTQSSYARSAQKGSWRLTEFRRHPVIRKENEVVGIRSRYRDALRILFVLKAGGAPIAVPSKPEIVSIFKGEARLLAFDFWMRNPDYLAAELLDLFEQNGEPADLAAVESILQQEEPDLRRVPMIRYFFGAFDRLDDVLSLLRSRDLIRITGLKGKMKVKETDFLLTVKGVDVCNSAVEQEPILKWYVDRAELVAKVAGDRGGTALKEQQYNRASYAETKLGGVIPPITSDVRERLQILKQTL